MIGNWKDCLCFPYFIFCHVVLNLVSLHVTKLIDNFINIVYDYLNQYIGGIFNKTIDLYL